MNYEPKFDELKREILRLSEKADALAVAYSEAEDFTTKFLKCCSKHKIKIVSIQTSTELIKTSVDFPFGVQGSVFAEGKEDGWPTIWAVVKELGIGGGCGNADQYQLNNEARAKLIDGVYEYKNRQWKRIE